MLLVLIKADQSALMIYPYWRRMEDEAAAAAAAEAASQTEKNSLLSSNRSSSIKSGGSGIRTRQKKFKNNIRISCYIAVQERKKKLNSRKISMESNYTRHRNIRREEIRLCNLLVRETADIYKGRSGGRMETYISPMPLPALQKFASLKGQ